MKSLLRPGLASRRAWRLLWRHCGPAPPPRCLLSLSVTAHPSRMYCAVLVRSDAHKTSSIGAAVQATMKANASEKRNPGDYLNHSAHMQHCSTCIWYLSLQIMPASRPSGLMVRARATMRTKAMLARQRPLVIALGSDCTTCACHSLIRTLLISFSAMTKTPSVQAEFDGDVARNRRRLARARLHHARSGC